MEYSDSWFYSILDFWNFETASGTISMLAFEHIIGDEDKAPPAR